MYRVGIRIAGVNLEQDPQGFIAALDEALSIGYRAVEIVPDDFDLIICGRLCEDVLLNLGSILRSFPFELSVHVPLRLNLFDREHSALHFEVLRRCAEICDYLKAGILVYHPGRYVDNVDFPRYGKPTEHCDKEKLRRLLSQEKSCLSTIADEFPDVTIAMENHRPYADFSPYSYAEFIGNLLEVIQEINRANVRMTLDTGHLNLAAAYYGENPLDWAIEAMPWTVHTHIHDNNGIVNFYTEKDKAAMLPFGRGDEHNIPGSGNFPFKSFFEIFSHYQGIHMVELTSRYLFPSKIRKAFEVVTSLLEGKKQTNSLPLAGKTIKGGSIHGERTFHG